MVFVKHPKRLSKMSLWEHWRSDRKEERGGYFRNFNKQHNLVSENGVKNLYVVKRVKYWRESHFLNARAISKTIFKIACQQTGRSQTIIIKYGHQGAAQHVPPFKMWNCVNFERNKNVWSVCVVVNYTFSLVFQPLAAFLISKDRVFNSNGQKTDPMPRIEDLLPL